MKFKVDSVELRHKMGVPSSYSGYIFELDNDHLDEFSPIDHCAFDHIYMLICALEILNIIIIIKVAYLLDP